MLRKLWIVAAVVGLAVPLFAADEPRGVEPGNLIPGPFNAFIVFGGLKQAPPANEPVQTEDRQNFGDPTRVNKFHDLVTKFQLDPTVAVFVREAPPAEDQPVAKLIKSLDQTVVKNRSARLHAFAIFLRFNNEFLKDDTRIPQIGQVRDFATKLELKEMPLAIDQSESDRTKAFKIGSDDLVTVLIYDNLKVRNRFVFTADKPLDDAGIKSVMDAVKAMIKK